MAVLSVKSFGGISPRTPARYLQDSQAQVAINCPVFAGSLQALPGFGSTVATLTKTGTPLTIYRFGQDIISDTQYWFHWTTDVNVCRSQIAGDTSEWTFYTGDGTPKATYNTIALSGSNYPTVSRPLGLPAPIAAPTVVAGTPPVGPDIGLPETRVYVYTVVNAESGFEFESAPSPASASVDAYDTQSVTISGFSSVPTGYTLTHRRIYRSVSGTFLFVAEIPLATTTYVDSILPDDLGEELPSLTWLPPPDDLKGLINLPNGMMAGFVGRDVYFCEPYRPHAWPLQYVQSLDYPIVGLGRIDTTLVVTTTGSPYFIQGASPDAMVVVKSDLEQSCASKRSIVSSNSSVIYASPDGLVMMTPSGSNLITEKYFTRAQWQAYFTPSTIVAFQHDMKYVAFYDNGVTQGGFIYDMVSSQFILHNLYGTCGYSDLLRDQLFVSFADRTIKKWLTGSALTYTWRSKKFTAPYPMDFGCAQVQAETYPLTCKVYRDGNLIHTQTVADRLPFRLPVSMGLDWEVQLEGTSEVFSIDIAQSMEELANV